MAYGDLGIGVDFRARDARRADLAVRAVRRVLHHPTRPPSARRAVEGAGQGQRPPPGPAGRGRARRSRSPGPPDHRRPRNPDGRGQGARAPSRARTAAVLSTPCVELLEPGRRRAAALLGLGGQRVRRAADELIRPPGQSHVPCLTIGPSSPSSAPRSARSPTPTRRRPWPRVPASSVSDPRSGTTSTPSSGRGGTPRELATAFANGRALLEAAGRAPSAGPRSPSNGPVDGDPPATRWPPSTSASTTSTWSAASTSRTSWPTPPPAGCSTACWPPRERGTAATGTTAVAPDRAPRALPGVPGRHRARRRPADPVGAAAGTSWARSARALSGRAYPDARFTSTPTPDCAGR